MVMEKVFSIKKRSWGDLRREKELMELNLSKVEVLEEDFSQKKKLWRFSLKGIE